MIIGSGNLVHNLGLLDFSGKTFDWATEFDEKFKSILVDQNHDAIIDYAKIGNAARLAVPTHDHYLPLIYAIAQQEKMNRFPSSTKRRRWVRFRCGLS